VPIKFGNDPPPIAPLAAVATEPPEGVKVPLSELFIATVPADPVENDVTKDLLVLIAEIVILPADAVEPLCTDFIIEEDEG
jgi:hypothetical protein